MKVDHTGEVKSVCDCHDCESYRKNIIEELTMMSLEEFALIVKCVLEKNVRVKST